MSTQHTVNVEKNADTLLDTIGRLFARNQSLQKGLATLTRRVQELETALAAEKERGNTLITPRGMETYNSKGVLQVVMGAVEETKTPTAADSPLQADIDARIAELEEQLKKEIGAQASMQAEIDRLRVTEAAYRNHQCLPRSAADSQLQADIEALRTRVANLEFALHPESSRRQAVSVSETCRADAFRQAVAYVVKQEIEKECRMGGRINRALR